MSARFLRAVAAACLAACCGIAPCIAPCIAAAAGQSVATIDGDRLDRAAFDVLLRYARLEDRDAKASAVIEGAVDDRLLARHAVATYTSAELFPEQRVAFAPEVAVDDRLVSILQAVFRDDLVPASSEEEGRRAIVAMPDVGPDALRAVFGDPRVPRVEYRLDEAVRARARQVELLRWRLPGGGTGTLSLADIYARQNVQGRIALHRLDADYLRGQVRARLAALLVLDWAERRLGKPAVAQLRRSVADREMAQALAVRYGLGTDIHDVSEHLTQLREAVTAPEIAQWYATHRERFRRIEAVRARHVRAADEAAARRAAGELVDDGSNFAEIARRDSIAPDRYGGGDLGWLDASRTDWLAVLAFAQSPGRTGAPVREPAAANAMAAWEIVRVEEQRIGYHAPDSETVRYLASRAIAERKAREEYAALRARLRKAAAIDVSGAENAP